jgi:hypothetical protein
MALILGGFTFTDYAIPEQVPQGGDHHLVVHKLIGGNRVVDAMGPDDADISWSGRFQGPGSTGKAMALDGLRKAGAQLPLVVDSQFYTVAIKKFEWDYQRPYQILYRITCVVVSSMGGAIPLPTTLDVLIGRDMGLAAGLIAGFSAAAPQ